MAFNRDDIKRQIFAHRGLWRAESEKNSLKAIDEAVAQGFAVEIDLRMLNHELVVSHDYPAKGAPKFLDIQRLDSARLALNIKEDGMSEYFAPLRDRFIKNASFFFDGSIPEMRNYFLKDLPIANRVSELEMIPDIPSKYIWLDAFDSDWWDERRVVELKTKGFDVVIVSPELHGRDPDKTWTSYCNLLKKEIEVGMCTDYPELVLERVLNV